jgi:hypothetical protein
MLTRLPNGGLEIAVRAPLIYLDHWAIREISSAPARRDHFLETFRTRGTLMFSVVNILEMARNSGDSYVRIRDLLDAVEPYWLLSDPDPKTVQDRENRGLLPPESFLVPLSLFGEVFKNLPEGTLRLGSALDALHDGEFRERAGTLLAPPSGTELRRSIQRARKRRSRGEAMAEPEFPKGSPMWISQSLIRFLVADNKKIVENDIVDLLHAAVPLRYAVILLLDKAWVNFATKLKLPDTQVFARPQLDEALEAIRSVDITRHQIIRPEIPRIIRA